MGRAKLLLPWHGTTVIGHLISQWQTLGAGQIAVVTRHNDVALEIELGRLSFSKGGRIENFHPEGGMFSSIVCAANWSGWNGDLSRWAIVLGDQPHLRTETLRQLLEFSRQHPGAICQPASGERAGHPVILPQGAFQDLRSPVTATLKDFLKLSPLPRVQLTVADAGVSLDMDTPEDYKRLTISNRVA
jgi:molybdenum cofactor cytidylyltransferase